MKVLAMTAALLLAAVGTQSQATPQFDITGVWNSQDGGTIQIFQDAGTGDITALYVNPGFSHRYKAAYDASGTVTDGTVLRVVRFANPPCSTKLATTYTIANLNTIYVNALVTQSTCGLVKGQQLTEVLYRVN
jgi:hypothetical protein